MGGELRLMRMYVERALDNGAMEGLIAKNCRAGTKSSRRYGT